jgi:hypothetical protein
VPRKREVRPGQVISGVTVIREVPLSYPSGTVRGVLARCSCGNEYAVALGNLLSGRSTSCGWCDYDEKVARREVRALLAARGFELVGWTIRRREEDHD